MKFKAMATVAMGLSLFGGGLVAEEAKKPAWYEKISASGFVDAYYQYNFNGLSSPSTPSGRAFDVRQQEFSLSGAKLALSESDAESKSSGELDLFYGPTAKLFNTTSPNESLAIEQAFVTKAFGPLTFKLGKFTTFVGTEVIETPANMNYSRGILFGQIPFYHVGLSATYALIDGLSLMGYTGNGNSVDTASSEYKDWGASLSYSKIKGLSLTAIYYMESTANDAYGVANAVRENIHYADILASYQAMDSLSANAEYLYKTQKAAGDTNPAGGLVSGSVMLDPSNPGKPLPYSPKWQGYALYLSYTTPLAGLSILPRFEQWYSPDQGQLATETTLTAKYATGALTHYLEYRNDWKNLGGFAGPAGTSPSTVVYFQNTLTYGATFSF